MRLSGRKRSYRAQPFTERQRLALLSLLALNLAIFVGQLLLDVCQPGSVRQYLALSQEGIDQAYSWQFITALFLHNGPWHLLGNLLIFYLLGRDLEVIIGQRHLIYLYLAGGIAGELGHLFLLPSTTVLYGACGGVAAVVAAYATILPELELTAMMFFLVPVRLKAKHIAYAATGLAAVLICVDRHGVVLHSAYLGGGAAGWLYAHLLGFGQPSFLQRFLRHQKLEAERIRHLSVDDLIRQEIDPLLEKISRDGIFSLTRAERRLLSQARQRMLQQDQGND